MQILSGNALAELDPQVTQQLAQLGEQLHEVDTRGDWERYMRNR